MQATLHELRNIIPILFKEKCKQKLNEALGLKYKNVTVMLPTYVTCNNSGRNSGQQRWLGRQYLLRPQRSFRWSSSL